MIVAAMNGSKRARCSRRAIARSTSARRACRLRTLCVRDHTRRVIVRQQPGCDQAGHEHHRRDNYWDARAGKHVAELGATTSDTRHASVGVEAADRSSLSTAHSGSCHAAPMSGA
jgi:hypothetical protein